MILRRLTLALRQQSWLAVAIEFVIVILGVVIGFQINAWNETRVETALAARYVEDIRSDIAADLLTFERVRGLTDARRDAAEAVLVAIETGGIDDPGVFVRQVDLAGRYSPPTAQRAAFDDLVATGRLRLIDRAPREAIVRYYREMDLQETGFELQRRRVFDDYLPLAVAALPLETQRWIYAELGEPLVASPEPAAAAISAPFVLEELRHNHAAATALKAIIRGCWSIERELTYMEASARLVLESLEEDN